MSNTDKSEIKRMVQDELKRILNGEIEKSLKSGRGKKEVTDIVRRSLVDLYKYMFNKRTTWSHEIKG